MTEKQKKKGNDFRRFQNVVTYFFYVLAAVLGGLFMALLLIVLAPESISAKIESVFCMIPFLGTAINFAAFKADKLNSVLLFGVMTTGWLGACFFHAEKVLWMKWLRVVLGVVYWVSIPVFVFAPIVLQVPELSVGEIVLWIKTNSDAQIYWLKVVTIIVTLLVGYWVDSSLTKSQNDDTLFTVERQAGSGTTYVITAVMVFATMVLFPEHISVVIMMFSMIITMTINIWKSFASKKAALKVWLEVLDDVSTYANETWGKAYDDLSREWGDLMEKGDREWEAMLDKNDANWEAFVEQRDAQWLDAYNEVVSENKRIKEGYEFYRDYYKANHA